MDRTDATLLAALQLWAVLPKHLIPPEILATASQDDALTPLSTFEVYELADKIREECGAVPIL